MPLSLLTEPIGAPAARRSQSAALPVIGQGEAMKVVLITSRNTRRWVIPKGWVEPGEVPHRGAAREAREEAGLTGTASGIPLGCYAYDKIMADGTALRCAVMVFRFRVTRMLNDWPERAERERRLFSPAAAAALVVEPDLARLLRGLAPG